MNWITTQCMSAYEIAGITQEYIYATKLKFYILQNERITSLYRRQWVIATVSFLPSP